MYRFLPLLFVYSFFVFVFSPVIILHCQFFFSLIKMKLITSLKNIFVYWIMLFEIFVKVLIISFLCSIVEDEMVFFWSLSSFFNSLFIISICFWYYLCFFHVWSRTIYYIYNISLHLYLVRDVHLNDVLRALILL